MKAAALVPLFAGLAALAPGARGEGPRDLEAEQVALYDLVAPGVAVLTAGRAVGAGFAVAPGLLLTAAHVVDGAAAVDVLLRDGRRLRGEVVERAAGGLDLALVRIPAAPPVLELAPSAALRPGTLVVTIGHPDGNRFTLGTGLVAQAAADAADPSLIRLQLPLRQGASGAPVVDRRGRVVGVVALGAAGTVTFAIRTEAALGGLRGLAGVAVEPQVARAEATMADAAPLSLTVSPRGAGGAGTAAADPAEPIAIRAPELVTAPPSTRPRLRARGVGARPAPPRPSFAGAALAVPPPRPVLVEERVGDGASTERSLHAAPGPDAPGGRAMPVLLAAALGALVGAAGILLVLRAGPSR